MSESINNMEQMKRLGFDAWADNLFVNMLEDYVVEGTGSVSIENDKFTANVVWDFDNVTFSLRCHTDEGWKETTKSIKR